jgi:STE24 endopeptidase
MTKEINAPEKKYNRLKLIFSICEFIVGLAFLLIVIFTNLSINLENWIRTFVSNSYLVLIIFVAILGLAESIILFPLSFTSGYVIERKFNLTNQKFGNWLWEKVKGMLISLPLVLLVLVIFYAILKNYPDNWWLIMGTILLIFSVILSRLAPILIFPLFYKFDKLKDEELAKKVSLLCEDVKMDVKGVYQFNLSKTTNKGNAAFTGLGRSRRVILGDTLLKNMTHNEILGVLAHELGHFKLKHIWKSIALGIITTYVGLYLVSVIYKVTYPTLGFSRHDQIAALPLMVLILTLYESITMPILNIYSRMNERSADDFAVRLMGDPEPFISGLNKLSKQNLSDRNPNPTVEFLFYSHPSIEKRVKHLSRLYRDKEPQRY